MELQFIHKNKPFCLRSAIEFVLFLFPNVKMQNIRAQNRTIEATLYS